MKKLLQDLHGKRHTRWDIEVSLSYYRMKNPRLCHSPSPREQGFFPFLPCLWEFEAGEVTLHLIWAERLGAELLATPFDPYLKRRGDHRLSDRIWFYLFHFIFPSALAVALWDMHTPALQVYPWPQQGLNRQSAICALQPAILYPCVSHTALPGPLLVLLYQTRKQNSPSALKENVCAPLSLNILFYSIQFVETSWVSHRVGFSDQELKEQWVKRNDLDTREPCDGIFFCSNVCRLLHLLKWKQVRQRRQPKAAQGMCILTRGSCTTQTTNVILDGKRWNTTTIASLPTSVLYVFSAIADW